MKYRISAINYLSQMQRRLNKTNNKKLLLYLTWIARKIINLYTTSIDFQSHQKMHDALFRKFLNRASWCRHQIFSAWEYYNNTQFYLKICIHLCCVLTWGLEKRWRHYLVRFEALLVWAVDCIVKWNQISSLHLTAWK